MGPVLFLTITTIPLTFTESKLIWEYTAFITNLKDCQGEWVEEFFLINNETVSGPSIHIDAGERVQLGVHPV